MEQKLIKALKCYALVGSVFYIILEMLRIYGITTNVDFIFNTVAAALYMHLIDSVSSGCKGVAGMILEFKPLVWIGKISYGIYLYRNFSSDILKGRLIFKEQNKLMCDSENNK